MKKQLSFFGIAITIAIVCIAIANYSCSNGKTAKKNKNALSGQISVSGAFALYPLAVKWADEFKKSNPGVRIDVSAGGAGKGITDVLSGVVDIGMVSRELDTSEVNRGAFGFAVAKDAVLPVTNAKNPQLKTLLKKGLTKQAALDIWINEKTTMHVYTRSDACGAAETFAKWMGRKQEDLKGTAIFGDPGVADAVSKDVVGIGYNNLGYVYDEKSRKPNPGIVVVPIDVNGNETIDANENFYATKDEVIKAIAEGLYPSPPARDLYMVTKGKPQKPEVIAFLKFILTKGQKLNQPAGYIKMSDKKCKNLLKQI